MGEVRDDHLGCVKCGEKSMAKFALPTDIACISCVDAPSAVGMEADASGEGDPEDEGSYDEDDSLEEDVPF